MPLTDRDDTNPTAGVAVGLAMALIVLVFWSITPPLIKYFAAHIDPWTSNGWRYAVAALLWMPLLIVLVFRGKLPKGLFRAALIPSLVNAAAQVCFCTAHYHIDPALLTFGIRSQMIFVALGAFLLFPGERAVVRSPVFLAGVVGVLGGTAGVLLFKPDVGSLQGSLGMFLSIAAGAGFAGYGLSVRRFMHNINSVVSFAAISQITATILVVLMLLFAKDRGGGAISDLSTNQFLLLLLSAVIGIATSHVFYYMSIKRLGVAVSTGVIQLQPLGVAAISIPWFGEKLTPLQWLCGLLAIGGAIAMLIAQQRVARHLARRAAIEKTIQAESVPRG